MPYAPATARDIEQMLAVIGAPTADSLFDEIPAGLRFAGELNIPLGISEPELVEEFRRMQAPNVDVTRELSFLGYGCYDHHVPAVCGAITARSEFATAYTPYQPEISQGTLQAIFEFQTSISELCGLPVSNASLYDGATAAAEAMYMCRHHTRRSQVVVLRTVSEQVRAVLRTYAGAFGVTLVEVDYDPSTGTTDPDEVRRLLGDNAACLLVQQPNVFGCLEPAPDLCEIAASAGAVPVVSCDPLSLGVLEAPGAYGAGIAIGDGQPLGNAMSFGGPGFGFMAAADEFVRRMPGRIVGQTVDAAGTRAYTLTLQTREQHIRREKATSNICTNQALCALAGTIYLAWLGPGGLDRLGTLLLDRSQLLREQLTQVPGVDVVFSGPSFKELVVRVPGAASDVVTACKRHGVHPGFELAGDYPELGPGALLVAVTEKRSDADIARLAEVLREVLA